MFYKTLLLIFFLSPFSSHALDWSELKEKSRPFLEEYFGEQISLSLLGPVPLGPISLPNLPKLGKGEKVLSLTKPRPIPKDQKIKYDVAYLSELYRVTRLGEIPSEKLGDWLNILSQGGSREGVYRAVVLGDIYYQLEQQPHPCAVKFIEYVPSQLEKFTGKRIVKKQLEGINYFMAKRMVVEKFLEIFDSFDNYEDLKKWYGGFSASLSREFPTVFKNKLRKNQYVLVHIDWANNVPLDFIKSEVIIKLHKVFNYLNF